MQSFLMQENKKKDHTKENRYLGNAEDNHIIHGFTVIKLRNRLKKVRFFLWLFVLHKIVFLNFCLKIFYGCFLGAI